MGIGALGAVISFAGAGVAGMSQIEQGKSQQAMANYNAAVQEQQAKQSEADARSKANAQRAGNQALMSKQRALYAKAGVTASGSPLLVQAEQAAVLEMGALDIERTGNVKAAYARSQAELDRMAGKVAKKAGKMQGYSTILMGAGQMLMNLDAISKGGGGSGGGGGGGGGGGE